MRKLAVVTPRPMNRSIVRPAIAGLAVTLIATCGPLAPGVASCRAAEAAPAAADSKTGKALYSTNCEACHPDGGNIIDPKKPVRDSAKLKDFETFLAWIRAPLTPMTPFAPDQLPDAQARELFRYVVEELAHPAAK